MHQCYAMSRFCVCNDIPLESKEVPIRREKNGVLSYMDLQKDEECHLFRSYFIFDVATKRIPLKAVHCEQDQPLAQPRLLFLACLPLAAAFMSLMCCYYKLHKQTCIELEWAHLSGFHVILLLEFRMEADWKTTGK